MKLRSVCLLFVVAFFGLASIASAEIINTMTLNYTGTYDAGGNSVDPIPFVPVAQPDGSTKYTVEWVPAYLNQISEFDVFYAVSGLDAGVDMTSFGCLKTVSGAVVIDDLGVFGGGYVANNPSVDPGLMGGATTPPGKSNAPSSALWFANFENEGAIGFDITCGTTETGNGNGTYGDYAAFAQVGEAAPTKIGTYYLMASGAGTFDFGFVPNPGVFMVIKNNANGLGRSVDKDSTLPFSMTGDSIAFTVVPEPSTIALLASGLMGLLCYAWRKRK